MTDNNNQVIDTLQNDIELLIESYIDTLNNPDDIYKVHTISGLFSYLYQNYVGDLLNNKDYKYGNRYNDIKLLDKLFYIYIDICYRYNNIPTILEYSLFTGVSRDIIHDWKTENRREITPEYVHTVKKWYAVCESALVKDSGVKSIFLLKASYGYNDEHIAQENITQTKVEQLPNLGLHNTITGNNNVIDLPVKSLETQ